MYSMKINRPLVNPTIEDFENAIPEQVPEESEFNTQTSPDQLDLNIGSSGEVLQQRISSWKMTFEKRQQFLDISIVWKSPAIPFALVSMLINALLLILGTIIFFNKIPLKIPFFYNSIDKHWEQADKTILFIIGILVTSAEAFAIYLTTKIFNSDKRLAITIGWVLTILNVFFLIAILQIRTLIF